MIREADCPDIYTVPVSRFFFHFCAFERKLVCASKRRALANEVFQMIEHLHLHHTTFFWVKRRFCSVVRNIALGSGWMPDIRQGMKMNKEKKVTSESQVSTLYSRPKIKDSLWALPARKGTSINNVGNFFQIFETPSLMLAILTNFWPLPPLNYRRCLWWPLIQISFNDWLK